MTDDQRAGVVLLPCAHCNGEAKQQRKEQEGYGPAFAVMCTACACSTPWVDTMGWAFALWNLRASDKREGDTKRMAETIAEIIKQTHEVEGFRTMAINDAALLITALIKPKPAGEAGGWVRCSERMPAEGEYVSFITGKTHRVGCWRAEETLEPEERDEDGKWRRWEQTVQRWHVSKVAHWRPLTALPPEPKTGEGGI